MVKYIKYRLSSIVAHNPEIKIKIPGNYRGNVTAAQAATNARLYKPYFLHFGKGGCRGAHKNKVRQIFSTLLVAIKSTPQPKIFFTITSPSLTGATSLTSLSVPRARKISSLGMADAVLTETVL